jgi:hypothetical protein
MEGTHGRERAAHGTDVRKSDEERLAELGLQAGPQAGWSGFSNFAISFTIISVLAGLLHDLRPGVEQRRPDRHLVGLADHLRRSSCSSPSRCRAGVGLSDRGRASTGGRPSWAARTWGWFTGWFNLIGLVGVVASVDYGAATFLNALLGLYASTSGSSTSPTTSHPARHVLLFVAILRCTR